MAGKVARRSLHLLRRLRARGRFALRHERQAVAVGVGATGLLSLLLMLMLLPKPFAVAHILAALGTLQVVAALHLALTSVKEAAADHVRPLEARDHAERERLEDRLWQATEREAHYRSLLEGQDSPIVSRDTLGRVTYANRAFCRLLGTEREAILGKPLHPTVLDGDRGLPAIGPHREARRTTQQIDTPHGPRWIEWEEQVISRAAGSSEHGLIGRDVTAERLRAAELAAGREEALAANHAKSSFLAAMSHEIRTPMSGILGMSSLLLGTEATPEQQTYARAIDRSARTLLALIDEILDFSKIEAGRLTLNVAPFSLEDCLEGVIELLAPRAHEKALEIAWTIEPGVPLQVAGDEVRIRQILLNLVGNAVKFTDTGSVCVHVRRTAIGTSAPGRDRRLGIAFCVEDTGIGISDADLPRLFAEFAQAERAGGRRKGCSGLGLAISRRLAQAMGGEISVQSQLGKGSTFRVDLVLLEQPGAELSGSFIPAAVARSRRVLIASDRALERQLAVRVLAASGVAAVETELALAERHIQQAAAPYNVLVVDAAHGVERARNLLDTAKDMVADRRVFGVVLIDAATRPALPAFRGAGFEGWAVRPLRPRAFAKVIAKGCCDEDEPAAVTTPATLALPAPQGASGRATRVLLAEDDDVNALLGSCVLQKAGCLPSLARTGREAVELVREGLVAGEPDFDIILMDIVMPELGGLDASTAIQKLYASLPGGARPAPPIVALTANAFAEDRERYLAAGLDDYLAKPFDRADLQRLLERWMYRVRSASAA